jgi:hypothetical protein
MAVLAMKFLRFPIIKHALFKTICEIGFWLVLFLERPAGDGNMPMLMTGCTSPLRLRPIDHKARGTA